MRREVKQQNLALTVSFIFLALVAFGFFWLWKTAQPLDDLGVTLEDKYSPVEISSVKQQAQELIQSKGNLAGMPVAAPVDNVGRENPFAGR